MELMLSDELIYELKVDFMEPFNGALYLLMIVIATFFGGSWKVFDRH